MASQSSGCGQSQSRQLQPTPSAVGPGNADYEAEDDEYHHPRGRYRGGDRSDADWWEGHLEGKPDVVGFFLRRLWSCLSTVVVWVLHHHRRRS